MLSLSKHETAPVPRIRASALEPALPAVYAKAFFQNTEP